MLLFSVEPRKRDKLFGTHTVSTLQQWLRDPSQSEDLIATAPFVGGFEWPTVMMITSTIYESEFHVRNIVMRSMCKLVWLKTNVIDQVHELNVSITHTVSIFILYLLKNISLVFGRLGLLIMSDQMILSRPNGT